MTCTPDSHPIMMMMMDDDGDDDDDDDDDDGTSSNRNHIDWGRFLLFLLLKKSCTFIAWSSRDLV